MAGRIQGITIRIDGDATPLTTALKSVDAALKKTNTNLRDLNKALKLDPGNTELLKDRQQELARAIQQTEERLDKEKAAYQELQAADKTPENVEKMRQLKTQIDLDTAALSQLKTEAAEAASVLGTQMQVAGQKLQEVGGKIKDIGSKISGVGQTMTTHVTMPIAAAFAGSIKAAVAWESAFTGVMKTVDETANTTYDDLKKAINEIAETTASSQNEVAAVMEIGGQLGVIADDLPEFAKTMIMLGDTTNLSAEEAATALARFVNITGESYDSVDNLGAVIVDLGNNFATSESEIVEMSTRLAAAGTVAGLSSTDILALSAAMSSVGINAEAGGTAMAQTLKAMGQAVEDNGDKLNTMASVAGLTADEFAAAWRSEPITAVNAFISGLSNLDEESESTISILDDLGMSGIRQSNMLQALALASDQMAGAIETANGAYEENSALQAEAEKRYSTTASKISQLKARFTEVAVSIGETLMPHFEKLIGFLEQLAEKWQALSPAQQEFILKAAAVVAAVGPVLMVIGGVITAIGTIVSAVGSVLAWLGSLVTFVTGTLIPVITTLAATISVPLAPILAIIAGVAALIAIFVHFFNTNEEFRAKVIEVWEAVKAAFASGFEQISAWVASLGEILAPIGTAFMDTFSAIGEFIGTWVDIISTYISNFLTNNQATIDAALGFLKMLWQNTLDVIRIAVETVFNAISTFLTGALSVIQNLFRAFTSILKGDWQSAWNYLVSAARSFIGVLLGVFNNLTSGIKQIFTSLVQNFKTWGGEMISGLVQGIKDKIGDVKEAISGIGDAIRERIHFSEPDVGPLSDFSTWAPDMMKLFAQGITDNASLITDAVNKSFNIKPVVNQTVIQGQNQATPASSGPISVNVTLEGDANRLYRVVRAEAVRNQQITGMSFA